MELGSLFLILALLVLVVLFISRPFLIRKGYPGNGLIVQVDHERSNLLAERDRILAAIQELDFDFILGKVLEETYTPQRSRLLMRGAEVLRRLDSIISIAESEDSAIAAATGDGKPTHERSDVRNGGAKLPDGATSYGEIEHAVNTIVDFPDDELEILLAKRRRDRREKSTGFCSSCGDPVRKSDRYCPKCGAKTG